MSTNLCFSSFSQRYDSLKQKERKKEERERKKEREAERIETTSTLYFISIPGNLGCITDHEFILKLIIKF